MKVKYIDYINEPDENFSTQKISIAIMINQKTKTTYPVVKLLLDDILSIKITCSKKITLARIMNILILIGVYKKNCFNYYLQAPVRVIKGDYKTQNAKWYKVEIFFQKGLYLWEYLDSDTISIIEHLKNKNNLSFDIIERT